MPYERGAVVLVLFPNSDLRTAKRRPALVVQAGDLNTGLSQTVVAMVSSNMARAGHPCRVEVFLASDVGKQTGLRTDSVIMTDNLATVLDVEIDRVIGVLPDMAAVDAALRHTFGL
jgi:mRNA interferase MazF